MPHVKNLMVTGTTTLDDIKKFIETAGPDARIRAKATQDGAQLYVRDMSLSGRALEWLTTREKDRTDGYAKAKDLITQKLTSAENLASGQAALDHLKKSVEAHKHDFYTNEITAGFKAVSNAISRKMVIKDIVISGRDAVRGNADQLAAVLQKQDHHAIVKAIASGLGAHEGAAKSSDIEENLKSGFTEFCKFMDTKGGGENAGEINFDAVLNFQKNLFKANQYKALNQLTNSDSGGVQLGDTLKTLVEATLGFEAPQNYFFKKYDSTEKEISPEKFTSLTIDARTDVPWMPGKKYPELMDELISKWREDQNHAPGAPICVPLRVIASDLMEKPDVSFQRIANALKEALIEHRNQQFEFVLLDDLNPDKAEEKVSATLEAVFEKKRLDTKQNIQR